VESYADGFFYFCGLGSVPIHSKSKRN